MRITFLLSRFPWPLDKGDKLRAYYQIRQLSINHDIELIALTDENIPQKTIDELKKYCTSVQVYKLSALSKGINILKAFFSGKPFQVGYFYNSQINSKIKSHLNNHPADVIFCQLVRMAEYGKDIDSFRILDYQDALSTGLKRRVSSAGIFFKLILKTEYKRLQKYENQIFDKFNQRLIITKTDRDLIPHPQKEKIVVLPNGVDTTHFYPREKTKEYDIIFAGNMNYPPNINAAEFLSNEIMPLVWKVLPDAKLILAGANPSPEVRNLKNDKVHITGWVEDIADAYASAKVFVAPMRIGTGLQNKLLEAMAMKLPTVTTPLANEALGAINNQDILVGNSNNEISEILINLLTNNSLYDKISQSGYDFVKDNYSLDKVANQLENILNS